MKPGYTYQTSEFDSEILRSSEFQLTSITIDSSAVYDPSGSSSTTKLPKGLLMTLDSDLSDGTYTTVDADAGNDGINGTPTQYMHNAVVLAETILDASEADQPVKAYVMGTFDHSKLKWNDMDNTAITAAQFATCQRIKVIDGPNS